ncbi:hypothetical protein [Spongiimicrobium salis]|uniref:hypothetical protein n=1 Tax=Spongiimicrobium salis TaxID=1667022 RepID=UPI00374DB922
MSNISGKKISFWSFKYIWDIGVILVLLVLPFVLYLHIFFSEKTNVLSLFGYAYVHPYKDNSVFIWVVLMHVMPMLLLLIWYFNTRYWWRHFILFPLFVITYTFMKDTFVYPDFIQEHIIVFAAITTTVFLLLIRFLNAYSFRKIKVTPIKLNIGSKEFYYAIVNRMRTQFVRKPEEDREYLKNLLYTQSLLESEINDTIIGDGLQFKKRRRVDFVIIVIMIVIIPILFLFHKTISANEMSIDLYFICIESYGFPQVSIFMWYLGIKLASLIILFIWFSTSKDWWRYALLSPLIIFTFQLWRSTMDDNPNSSVDEIAYIKALPTILLVVLALFIISRAVKYQSKILDVYENITQEIESLLGELEKSNSLIEDTRSKFTALQKEVVSEETAKEQLNALLELRKKLEEQLNERKE